MHWGTCRGEDNSPALCSLCPRLCVPRPALLSASGSPSSAWGSQDLGWPQCELWAGPCLRILVLHRRPGLCGAWTLYLCEHHPHTRPSRPSQPRMAGAARPICAVPTLPHIPDQQPLRGCECSIGSKTRVPPGVRVTGAVTPLSSPRPAVACSPEGITWCASVTIGCSSPSPQDSTDWCLASPLSGLEACGAQGPGLEGPCVQLPAQGRTQTPGKRSASPGVGWRNDEQVK